MKKGEYVTVVKTVIQLKKEIKLMINQFDELKPLEMIALKNKDRKADVTFFVRGG